MVNLLGADGNQIGSIIGIVLLIGLLVAYVAFGFVNRKKQQEQAMKMLNELKKGDKVVTNAGIYGEIVDMKETNMGKVVTIKTGEDKPCYITLNASVILGIDTKEDLILDENGNPIDDEKKEDLKTEVLKEKANKTEEKKSPADKIREKTSNKQKVAKPAKQTKTTKAKK